MGLLADSRSRSKISKDPNNTRWLRDTSTFGQKILRAQGWEPGQFLGVQNAAHSELHTAANASYIRVSMKDDMKGLGFNKASEDVVTGLDVFSDLLSRLNGKSEEAVAGERQARLVMKTNVYVEQKWGPMRFVRGGLLVGDDMKEVKPSEEDSAAPDTTADNEMTSGSSKKEKKSKKRKVSDLEENDVETDSKKEKRRRKEERKARKASTASATDEAEDTAPSDDKKERRKKKKKSKDKSSSGKDTNDELAKTGSTDAGSEKKSRTSKSKDKKSSSGDESESKEDRKSKKSKKEKKEKKEKKKREKGDAGLADSKPSESSEQEEAPNSAAVTRASTPAGSGTGTSTPRGSRNFVRSRFIAAKRQAMLDTKALNQIFMVKT